MPNDPYATDATAAIMQLVPLMIIQVFYAIIVALMASKQKKNAWLWTILTLIPGIGMIVFAIFFIITQLSMLDRLNALELKS